MKILYEERFVRDLKKVRDDAVLTRVKAVIREISDAPKLESVRNIRKLSGNTDYYRIRIGDYRLGMSAEDDAVIFVRFLHRKDIYRYFP